MKRPVAFYMLLIMASIFLFFFLNLVLGSVSIPLRAVWNILWGTGNESVIWQNIIWKSRVPQALTALAAGAGLSVSGLQMQTVFRNPLAGPSVLGISSGASMGVAFVVLLSGSLGGVALSKLGFMGEIALTIAAIAGSLSIMALVTAYCGPIIFLGLAVPHLCRGMFRTSDHRILMPASLLAGASLALVCNLIARMPGFEGALPVNSVTALVGAPVVMSVLFNKRRNEMNE